MVMSRSLQAISNIALRERSGNVQSTDPLVSFLYLLLRDHMTAGDVESMIIDCVGENADTAFCNGYLAKYAEDLAQRLTQKQD